MKESGEEKLLSLWKARGGKGTQNAKAQMVCLHA